MFAASFAARASAGADMTIAIRNAVAASTRPARPAKARATEVFRVDNPSMFSLLVSPLTATGCLLPCTKLQKNLLDFNQRAKHAFGFSLWGKSILTMTRQT